MWEYVMLLCLITEKVNLNHLNKVVYGGCLHCKVTIFPFVIKKYLWEDTLRPYKYPISHHTFTH